MVNLKRQVEVTPNTNPDDDYDSWWWSPTGVAVRYTLVAALFAIVLLYFVIGYIHARRRIRRNVPPLAYHRWMVRRSGYSSYGQPQYYPYSNPPHGYQQAYPMQEFAPPPPAYNPADAPPPVYQAPQGASKVMADQAYSGPSMRAGEGSAGAGTQSHGPVPRS